MAGKVILMASPETQNSDNAGLSVESSGRKVRKRKTLREAPDLEAFVKRMFRALVKRAAGGDLEAVEALANLGRACQRCTQEAGEAAWKSGYSYTQIGDALGITRQAARQRFGGLDR